MSIVKFGSARSAENGGANGNKGDQKNGNEVSIQDYYMHNKGWTCLRAISDSDAFKLAQAMRDACNNNCIGYGQADRDDVINELKRGHILKNINVDCNCDCSSLVRACIYEAVGKDVGNFNTTSEVSVLLRSGLFIQKPITNEADCKLGDILTTKTSGHTVICVDGFARNETIETSNTVKVQFNAPILKKGAQGKFVRWWQALMDVDVDGSFGPKTDNATRNYQSKNGIASTGTVDEKTWNIALK